MACDDLKASCLIMYEEMKSMEKMLSKEKVKGKEY